MSWDTNDRGLTRREMRERERTLEVPVVAATPDTTPLPAVPTQFSQASFTQEPVSLDDLDRLDSLNDLESPHFDEPAFAAGNPGGTVSLRDLAVAAQTARASDIHLTEHHPALMRVDGSLTVIPGGEAPASTEWFRGALEGMMTAKQLQELADTDEYDFSVEVPGVARFRVNVFRQLGKLALAMRFIPAETKPFEELGVPAIAGELVTRPRGLVLVTGPTGSGKSTTLAAMIDLVNRKLPLHIVTIEDPVEFRHQSKTALVHQREIGSDTRSFSEAMRRVLRQDPDIILIGELRDPESISIALTAAETGHLVMSTLHTQSAAKSINRMVDAFAPEQQQQVRSQIGDALQGIITQTLLPRNNAPGRVIATEVLVNTPAIANLIREGEISQIYSMQQAGRSLGMHTLDQDLRKLYEQGQISAETAQSRAADPKAVIEGLNVRSGLVEESWLGTVEGNENKGWLS
ncbi:type IV pilus twitching motility protein PilT [Leucobacter sp. HY1910]